MSASAPSLRTNSDNENPVRYWLIVVLLLGLSVLAHGLIFGWLAFFSPVKELVSFDDAGAESTPAVSASAERIQEVAEQIQATQAEEAQAKVEELLSTEQSLAELQTQTQTEFSALANELATDAPQRSQDAINTAMQAQAQAEQAQAEANQAIADMKTARDTAANAPTPEEKTALEAQANDAANRAADAQARAKEAQGAATSAQETAAQQMNFQGGLDEAKTAQSQAAEAQTAANTKQDEAAEARGSINGLKKAVERATNTLASAQKNVVKAKEIIAQKEGVIPGLEESVRQQQERLDQAKQAQGPNVQKEVEKIQKAMTPVTKRLDTAKSDLENQKKKLAEIEPKVATAQTELNRATAELSAAPEKAQAAQAEALKAQQDARAKQASAQSAAAKAFAATAATSQATAASMPAVEMSAAPSLEGKNFAELYNTAVETEKRIAERFQAIRAAQVAVQKQIPLSEAQKYVQMAVPLRSELPTGGEAVTDAKALEAQNASIEKALKELESMLSLTRGMASQARTTASANSHGTNISVEAMKAQAAQEQQLAAMATEAEGLNTVDLTEIMKQIAAGNTGGAHTGGQGLSQNGGPAGGPDLGGSSGSGGNPGYGSASGRAGIAGAVPSFPPVGAPLESVPGRKVHAGGNYEYGSKWMFIDSWWVIGPFPNPARRNLETRFPPESVVDLDAVYPVDNSASPGNPATVHWQFVQNATAMVKPPIERSYVIYYAYTELWFDEERDLWIATGSDDYSKIWINDLMVWASGTQHKPWRANEGYRKVHFKKGLNRILLRLENGQHSCAFSFMICMKANP